ncbi:hypothetical protein [Melittangium boletus]|uniref:hypothetical protein n=1 Tax=Melittangium boletus TaxID=83453 RepID=UPI003DA66A5C
MHALPSTSRVSGGCSTRPSGSVTYTSAARRGASRSPHSVCPWPGVSSTRGKGRRDALRSASSTTSALVVPWRAMPTPTWLAGSWFRSRRASSVLTAISPSPARTT